MSEINTEFEVVGESFDLVVASPKIIAENDLVEQFIIEYSKHMRSFVADTSTAKGRKQIISNAAAIAKRKVEIFNFFKEKINAINKKAKSETEKLYEGRKRIESALDALKIEIREPVTKFENDEAERIAKIKEQIDSFRVCEENVEAIEAKLAELANDDFDYQEFTAHAESVKEAAKEALNKALDEIIEAEKEAARIAKERAELEQLRKEKEEREQKERDSRKLQRRKRNRSWLLPTSWPKSA